MCGRFTLRANLNLILQQFALTEVPDLTPRYNIAPTQMVPVIRAGASGRELVMLRWGLIPSWSKDEKMGNRLINARSETAAQKPSFRSAFRRRRCLVVADGFYEWKKVNPDPVGAEQSEPADDDTSRSARPKPRRTARKPQPVKQPYFIQMRDERPFAFAGLWETWPGPKGAELPAPIQSCTILTTEPNDLMQPLHDRMPVILPSADYSMWLDPEFESVDALQALQRPYAADEMIATPVSTFVNSPRNDAPQCIEAAEV